MPNPALHTEHHHVDICVIGGGMAGLCAALASARHNARTLIIHDRPMFGGNASSEVRMWICGAHGKHNKETGILEELQLENLHRNPAGNYPVWDGVLHGKALHQPHLTPLLNTTCLDAETRDNHIVSVTAWQLTTQTFHHVTASHFIDCSGDSILAPLTGAPCRWGRESCDEFGEDIEPAGADRRTMGNSLLIQLRNTDAPQPFTPPPWAYQFDSPTDFEHRMQGVNARNFWWVEVGGIDDTIHDAEAIRDELMKIAYGIWDYIKNRAPERDRAANWELYWIGRLPGKRESRRYEGDHILTQHDIEAGGRFDDVVAFGGWTMDDHHPAGLLYPGKPTLFHPAPSPYGIPYRCLYSRAIDNLLFAGRNISVTHAALSSTRVMATCAVIGQAAGTAAALAVAHGTSPRGVYQRHLGELQQTLMDDDCYLPGLARAADALMAGVTLQADGQHAERLVDGHDRDREGEAHAWEGVAGDAITLSWTTPTRVGGLRITFDSDLNHHKRMPCAYPLDASRCAMPGTLVKAYRIETCDADGHWHVAHHETCNIQRLVRARIERDVTAVRLVPEATWGGGAGGGGATVRIFAFEAVQKHLDKIPDYPERERFADVRARVPAADLAEPAKADAGGTQRTHSA
ncbi:MAG: FAD-dependent oxidoreductase [Phycisphaeraceae bacterium]